MSMVAFAHVLQVVVGLGLLNVWLLRSRSTTSYRGRNATTLQQEFAVYGLPPAAFFIVGTLKVVAGIVLLASLSLPMPARLAAVVVAALMIGALVMHARVKDPMLKFVPAAAVLLMCGGIVVLL